MSDAAENPSGRIARLFRVLAFGSGALLVAAFAVAYCVATLELYSPVRQEQAGEMLTRIFGRPVEVRGPVVLTPGLRLGVRIEDSYIERSSGGGSAKARVFETVEFDAPYSLLRGNASGIRNFRMSGAEIEYHADGSGSTEQTTSAFELPSTLINSAIFDNLELTDVLFRFVDEADGWNETFQIKSLKLETPEGAQSTDAQIDAAVNGTPLTATGTVPASARALEEKSGPFELTIAFPGLETGLNGTVDTSEKIARIKGNLTSNSPSIAALLASLGLESAVDGKATLTWSSSGPVNSLDIDELKLDFEGDNGDAVTIAGKVDDIFQGSIFDVRFDTRLAPPEKARESAFAVNLKEISGRVSGPLDALAVDQAHITTDAVLLEFDEIGPITVGRVIKGADDRVGLKDITILDGPKNAPYLEMKGEVEDILAFAGVSLSGSYRFPAALLLNRPAEDAPELGQVKGTVSLNEASGAFGLDELSGEVTGSDLLKLKFEMAIPEFRVLEDLEFSTQLAMKQPEKILKALGIETARSFPALGFNGSSGLSPAGAKLSGELSAGVTQIRTELDLKPEQDSNALMLAGSISSTEMDFTDLADLSEFAKLATAGVEDDDSIELNKEFEETLRADIALNVKKIVAGKKHAGNLTGNLKYDNDHLQLAGLKLDFIGGKVTGDFGVTFGKDNWPASAHGRMEKFPLSSLMNEVGMQAPVSSTVYASFDVTGNAASETGFLKSLSGNVTASLWGGTLPNRLLDLTGLNVFTWLVTSNQDHTTKIVCAVLPLHFKNGTATSKRMIVETQNVQLVGAGSVDFRSGALDLSFAPRAKRKQLVEIVSPFEIHGTLGKPDVKVRDAGPGRAIGEVVSLPLNLVSHIFRGSGPIDEKAKPCVLPKNSGPK
ncbi:hypothetical protein IWQ48_000598 [Labrenzia sp. EL_13]|nr:hypothetical protein [Labrenzia sp. EL_13]